MSPARIIPETGAPSRSDETRGDALAQIKIRARRTTSGSGFHISLRVTMEKGFSKREGLDAHCVAMVGYSAATGVAVMPSACM